MSAEEPRPAAISALRAAALGAVLGAVLGSGCGGEPTADPARPPASEDPRLAWLLAPFPRDGYYDVDTTDVVGILIEVLRFGHRDPLQHARKELADLGPEGVEAARRVIELAWNDPDRFNDIRNALDVLSYSREPSAHDVIRKVLDHPAPVPRQASWRALRQHPDPRDYDRVRELFDTEDGVLRPELALLLHDLDPERAEDQYAAWIAAGLEIPIWPELASKLAVSPRLRTQERCCGLDPLELPMVQALLAAACARSGDEQALELLRSWQRGEHPVRREMAVDALGRAELAAELVWSLEREPSPQVRLKAVGALAAVSGDLDLRPYLLAGMSDADQAVANACRRVLLQRGDAEAIESAVQDLSSRRPGVAEEAVLALSGLWKEDEALARRCLELLVARHAEEASRPLAERQGVLRAIGLVPLEESTRLLHELSRGAKGRIQDIPAERWLVLMIGNQGEPGERRLIEALETEGDLLRRLDLIEALSAHTTERSRAWLLARADADGVPPYELLFIADRLTRMGPTAVVAPTLKRATARVEQDDVRRALQGLLWLWYPRPRA